MDHDQVKKTIRAVLISAKNGLTPQQLLKDYDSIVGEPLPFKNLGFKSFTEAIHRMPDVIRVEMYGGRTILRGVPDKSSRHVASLVSRQRNSKNYCGIVAAPQQSSSARRYGPPPIRSLPKPKELPSLFVIKIRQLMMSYPNGLPLMSFQSAFQRRFGYYANITSWGFDCLTEAFQSIPETVELTQKGTCGDLVLMPVSKRNKFGM